MFLTKVTLFNFKNYRQFEADFPARINCITGRNGAGKTNVLDAIHFLCLTKSNFNYQDQQLVHHGQEQMGLQAVVQNEVAAHLIKAGFRKGGRKEFSVDDVSYTKSSDHVGRFPVVMVAPDDHFLIHDGSEERRRVMDNVLSQLNQRYLNLLVSYNKTLAQRNALLRAYGEGARRDSALEETYEHQLAESGSEIFAMRKKLVDDVSSIVSEFYKFISNDAEPVSVTYESDLLKGDLKTLLHKNMDRDLLLQRTEAGVHRDDLLFQIDKHRLRKFGSQGQQKSFVLAFKLALHRYFVQQKGIQPILLLDDLFDKLDEHRCARLLDLITRETFGQTFITDTDGERIAALAKTHNHLFHYLRIAEQ